MLYSIKFYCIQDDIVHTMTLRRYREYSWKGNTHKWEYFVYSFARKKWVKITILKWSGVERNGMNREEKKLRREKVWMDECKKVRADNIAHCSLLWIVFLFWNRLKRVEVRSENIRIEWDTRKSRSINIIDVIANTLFAVIEMIKLYGSSFSFFIRLYANCVGTILLYPLLNCFVRPCLFCSFIHLFYWNAGIICLNLAGNSNDIFLNHKYLLHN